MNFPPEFVKDVALYHLPTTGGAKQPYPASADVNTSGALIPMDRHSHALEGGDLMDPFELYLDAAVDVRVGDKAVIGGTTYFVKRVFNGYAGPLAHKRCSLSTRI